MRGCDAGGEQPRGVEERHLARSGVDWRAVETLEFSSEFG
jgi:hypothetical protein